jgi:hypothetical protein
MEAYYPISALAHGQALNITVLSYAGGLYFGFTGCADKVPHLQHLAVYTGEALDELEQAFAGGVAAAPKKRAGARTKPAARKGAARKQSVKKGSVKKKAARAT